MFNFVMTAAPIQQSATIYGCQWDLCTYVSALLN